MPEHADDRDVASGLPRQPLVGAHQHQRQISDRGAGGHVGAVLFVARRVYDDEFAPRRREEAVGHVDGDVLLALGGEAVEQQRIVEILALRAVFVRIGGQCFELISEQLLQFIKQTAEQRRLAMIDRAAGHEAQQALRLAERRCAGCELAGPRMHVHQK